MAQGPSGRGPQDRREDIKDVEFAWPMPLCRSLGRGLWEVRSTLTQGRIARVLFCEREGRMILLHAFIKKTQKTPAGDLELAIKRKKEIT
jgi:phage-related protein